ncbi:Uncharacterised protein r2_g3880 [Pycnogonum litorale]
MGDVEAMYYQVKVPVSDRDMLRFVWPKDNDIDEELVEYRMMVHPFGGVWGSSTANYALRRTADDNRNRYPSEVSVSVLSDFYVDDWLMSTESAAKAITLVQSVKDILEQGGFKLTKFLSTDKNVMKLTLAEDRVKCVTDVDLDIHGLPNDRALGVKWNPNTDMFYFEPKVPIRPHTRRGIMSVISSIYYPLDL